MSGKSTRRALLMSALAILACAAMLVGTTFAWFTDTASTAVNTITSGRLKVDIVDEDGESIQNTGLQFVSADGVTKGEAILWEPNATYKTTGFKIKNNGNLALKYKLALTGITGSSDLLKVITFSVVNKEGVAVDLAAFEGHLDKAGELSDTLYIQGHMAAEAGNEYQEKELNGIGITVYATQYTYEYDSKDNQYDKDAEYATAVSTLGELEAAVNAGENVVLKNDLALTSVLTIPSGKEITIDLNGKAVTATGNFVTVEKDSKLTVTGGTVTSGRYAFNVKGGEVVVNDGNITAQECVYALFGGSKLTVNGGTFTAKDNAVIATNSSESNGCAITINGGVFNANITSAGYIACGVYVANKDTVVINRATFNVTDGVGILMRAGNTTVGKDVVINLTNTGKVESGKIGDAVINITTPAYLVADIRSQYPGLDESFTITNNSSYTIVEYK